MTVKKAKQIEEALHLVKLKMSYREAARKVGLHHTTVERWAKREGIKSPHARKLITKKVFGVTEIKPEPSLWQRIKRLFNF